MLASAMQKSRDVAPIYERRDKRIREQTVQKVQKVQKAALLLRPFLKDTKKESVNKKLENSSSEPRRRKRDFASIIKRHEERIRKQKAKKASSSSFSERRRRRLEAQKMKGRNKLSQDNFEKMWNLTRKKQNKVAKIRMPPREHKPTNINEFDDKELAALPDTVCLHHIRCSSTLSSRTLSAIMLCCNRSCQPTLHLTTRVSFRCDSKVCLRYEKVKHAMATTLTPSKSRYSCCCTTAIAQTT